MPYEPVCVEENQQHIFSCSGISQKLALFQATALLHITVGASGQGCRVLTYSSVEDAVHDKDHDALEGGEDAEQPFNHL